MKRTFIILLSLFSLSLFAQTEQLIRQISFDLDKIEGLLPQINILAKKGEKAQAKIMVTDALKQIESIEKNQQLVAQLDENIDEDLLMLSETQEIKNYLVNKANQLRYVYVFIQCQATLFDGDYPSLKSEIKGQLSNLNFSYVENEETADWIVNIIASTREGGKMAIGSTFTYFAYVDATISIYKASTRQRIFEDKISEKGGHTHNYEQAARDAYKHIVPRISSIIKEQIQQ